MEITRIGGGIEYRPEIMTLVLPGDIDYRVRTVRTSSNVVAPTTGNANLIPQDGTAYVRVIMSDAEKKAANDGALAHLRYLGDLEVAGSFQDYPGMNVRDEYAGGHRGIIDLWV